MNDYFALIQAMTAILRLSAISHIKPQQLKCTVRVWLLTAPGNTGPHRARTGPEMTDYFASTTVTSRIKA